MKNWLLAVVLLMSHSLIKAQNESSVLIYSESPDYLVPYIEKTITDLRDTSRQNLFNDVESLNRLFANMNYELYLRDIMKYYSSSNYYLGNEAKKVQQDVSVTLASYDYLLKIKTFVFEELVEYQISLFQSLLQPETPKADKTYFPSLKIDEPLETINFVIDLKRSDYKEIIDKNLKKLFPETNHPPVARISHNKNEESGKVFVGLGDTLTLETLKSYDVDSPFEDITYEWKQIQSDGNLHIAPNQRLRIDRNGERQKLTFTEIGEYIFTLQLFDGIGYSKIDTVFIEVIDKPVILIGTSELIYQWATSITEQNDILSKSIISEQLSIGLTNSNGQLDTSGLKVESVNPLVDSLKLITLYLTYKDCGCSYEELLKDFSKTPYSISRTRIDSLGFLLDFETSVGLAEDLKEFRIFYEKYGVRSNVETLKLKFRRYSPFLYKLNYFLGSLPYREAAQSSDTSLMYGYQGLSFGISGLIYREFGLQFDFGLPFDMNRDETPIRLDWFTDFSIGYTFLRRPYESNISEVKISWILSSFDGKIDSSFGGAVSLRRPMFYQNLFIGFELQILAQIRRELEEVALLEGIRPHLKFGISYRPRLKNLKRKLLRRRLFPDLY